jgi:hypothetical protein
MIQGNARPSVAVVEMVETEMVETPRLHRHKLGCRIISTGGMAFAPWNRSSSPKSGLYSEDDGGREKLFRESLMYSPMHQGPPGTER